VKNEFLAVEDIPNIDDGKLRYDIFVKAYNETRGFGGINGLTPSEMFLQRLITCSTHQEKQQSVSHVSNSKCNLSVQVQQLVNYKSQLYFVNNRKNHRDL
jgi:hypothetical protein